MTSVRKRYKMSADALFTATPFLQRWLLQKALNGCNVDTAVWRNSKMKCCQWQLQATEWIGENTK